MTLETNDIRNIITGLIGTAIFYILLLFLKKFGNWFILFLSKLSKRFSNYLYKNLSLGNTIEPLLTLIIIFPILLIVNISIYQQTIWNSKILAINQYSSWNQNTTNEIVNIEETLEILKSIRTIKNDSALNRLYKAQKVVLNKQKENLINESKKIQKANRKIESYHRKSEELVLALAIVSIFILIFFYFKYLIYHFIISKNREFEYKLTILRPFISNKEYYELKKDWNLIASEIDFNKVNKKIEEYVNNLN